jgi:hypothetical protein
MAEDVGNAALVRAVAIQLFDVWKAEQANEAKETRRWFGGNVAGWTATVFLIGGAIAAVATTFDLADDANARSLRNESSIAALKADNGDRLARIETKIDLMMEERKR